MKSVSPLCSSSSIDHDVVEIRNGFFARIVRVIHNGYADDRGRFFAKNFLIILYDIHVMNEPFSNVGIAFLEENHFGLFGISIGDDPLLVFPVSPDIIQAAVGRIFPVDLFCCIVLELLHESGFLRIIFEYDIDTEGIVVTGFGFGVPLFVYCFHFPSPSHP